MSHEPIHICILKYTAQGYSNVQTFNFNGSSREIVEKDLEDKLNSLRSGGYRLNNITVHFAQSDESYTLEQVWQRTPLHTTATSTKTTGKEIHGPEI
jgi:hypothetical protein